LPRVSCIAGSIVRSDERRVLTRTCGSERLLLAVSSPWSFDTLNDWYWPKADVWRYPPILGNHSNLKAIWTVYSDKRASLILLTATLIGGCATGDGYFLIEHRSYDDPESQRFLIEFQNGLNKPVCITPAYWPNVTGRMDSASGVASILVNDTRFRMEHYATDFCPGCATVVQPGELLTGHIPYSEFKLPTDLYFETKTLEFKPRAYFCD